MFLFLSLAYFFKLSVAFAPPLATVYTTSDVTNPSENADSAVVVAAATTLPINAENISFLSFLFSYSSMMQPSRKKPAAIPPR